MGTEKGVVKCRATRRLLEPERWGAKPVNDIEDMAWQPALGHTSGHVPGEIDGGCNKANRE